MEAGDLAGLSLAVDEDRQQRAMLCLADVAYGIEAHFEMTDRAGPGDNAGKHAEMFRRRAAKGQCFHQPCLGVREFPADFKLVEEFPEASRRTATWAGCCTTSTTRTDAPRCSTARGWRAA